MKQISDLQNLILSRDKKHFTTTGVSPKPFYHFGEKFEISANNLILIASLVIKDGIDYHPAIAVFSRETVDASFHYEQLLVLNSVRLPDTVLGTDGVPVSCSFHIAISRVGDIVISGMFVGMTTEYLSGTVILFERFVEDQDDMFKYYAYSKAKTLQSSGSQNGLCGGPIAISGDGFVVSVLAEEHGTIATFVRCPVYGWREAEPFTHSRKSAKNQITQITLSNDGSSLAVLVKGNHDSVEPLIDHTGKMINLNQPMGIFSIYTTREIDHDRLRYSKKLEDIFLQPYQIQFIDKDAIAITHGDGSFSNIYCTHYQFKKHKNNKIPPKWKCQHGAFFMGYSYNGVFNRDLVKVSRDGNNLYHTDIARDSICCYSISDIKNNNGSLRLPAQVLKLRAKFSFKSILAFIKALCKS